MLSPQTAHYREQNIISEAAACVFNKETFERVCADPFTWKNRAEKICRKVCFCQNLPEQRFPVVASSKRHSHLATMIFIRFLKKLS